MIIGNTFQNTGVNNSGDTTPDYQKVYILKVYDEDILKFNYYAFMLYKFQNGSQQTSDPATDKRCITIKYKLIYTEEN